MDLLRVWGIYYLEHNALYQAHHRTRWPINWCHDAKHVILPKIEHPLETGLTIAFDGQDLFSDTSDPWSMTTRDLIDTDQYWCGTPECSRAAHSYCPTLQHPVTLWHMEFEQIEPDRIFENILKGYLTELRSFLVIFYIQIRLSKCV